MSSVCGLDVGLLDIQKMRCECFVCWLSPVWSHDDTFSAWYQQYLCVQLWNWLRGGWNLQLKTCCLLTLSAFSLGVSTKVAEPKNKNWIWTLKHVLICRLYLKVLFYLIWTAPQSSNEKEKQTFNPFCDFSEHNINQETSQLQAMVACWLILKP